MKDSLATGTIYLTFSSVLFMVSGYITNIWLGRSLGPEVYGMYGIIVSLITIVNLTQVSGIPQAVSKYVASNSEEIEAVYKTGFLIQVVSTSFVSLLFFLLSKNVAVLLKDPGLVPYLQLASLVFPFYGLFTLLTGYYNGLHYFRKQALMHIIYSVFKTLAVIGFAIFFGLYGVVFGFIVSSLIAMLSGFHIFDIRSKFFSFKKLTFFSLPLICLAIFSTLLQSVDLLLIKSIMQSNTYVGFYVANQSISIIPYYSVIALGTVLFPSISKTVSQKLKKETQGLIKDSLRFGLMVTIPSAAIISASSREILTFLYSSTYERGAESLSILVIGVSFLTIFTLLTTIISGSGSPLISCFLAGLGVLISFVLCAFLVPWLGLSGASISTTVASLCVMLAAGFIVYQKFHALFSLESVLKILLAALVIYTLASVFTFEGIMLPFYVITLFIIYFILLALLKEITYKDWKKVKVLIPFKLPFNL